VSAIRRNSHAGFLRRSGLYIVLNALTSVWELGFLGVTVRLPGDGYATFWALLKIFFIVTTPIMAFQFVVGKEVASFSVLGEYGKRRYFVVRTIALAGLISAATIVAGIALSPYIQHSLDIDSVLPVVFLFLTIALYFPIPVFFGAVQGMKKFYTLGFMQMSWGFLRLLFGWFVVSILSGGLTPFVLAVAAATLLTSLVSFFPARQVFVHPPERVEKGEMLHAYGLVFPIIVTLFCVTVMKNIDVVFAKGYFDPGVADAYTCAASVGSGFFILSAVFMVMFPMVSEESTRGGDPIILLVKSCLFVVVFSSVGILAALFFPGLFMYVITLGKNIPGAPPLIRLIGFAVVPMALINITSNYFLAKHQRGFIPILAGGMCLQLLLIVLVHSTPVEMLAGIIAANFFTLCCMMVYVYIDHRRFVGDGAPGNRAGT